MYYWGKKFVTYFFYWEILKYIAEILIYLLFWNATQPFKFYSGLHNGHIKFFFVFFYTNFCLIKQKFIKSYGK